MSEKETLNDALSPQPATIKLAKLHGRDQCPKMGHYTYRSIQYAVVESFLRISLTFVL